MPNKTILAAIIYSAVGMASPMSALAEEIIAGTETEQKELIESGTVEVQAEQLRLIIGGAKGTGVLHFGGQDYKFKLSGKSLGGVGVTKVDGVGTVYNLNDINDFPGSYAGMGVGAVAVKGAGASNWENSKGVVIKMTSRTEGVALNMGMNQVDVEFVE